MFHSYTAEAIQHYSSLYHGNNCLIESREWKPFSIGKSEAHAYRYIGSEPPSKEKMELFMNKLAGLVKEDTIGMGFTEDANN